MDTKESINRVQIALDATDIKKPTHRIALDAMGQTLLFVVVAVTIALAVGVSVTTRTLNLSSRISRTDTAQRVIAAAEGGIERLLVQPESFLDALEVGTPDCSILNTSSGMDGVEGEGVKSTPEGDKCIIEFVPTSQDKITAMATVDAEKFSLNADDHYWFNLEPGYVKEVNLNGYSNNSLLVCWDNTDAAVYYTYYNTPSDSCENMQVSKGGLISSSFSGDISESGFERVSLTKDGFDVCGNIDLSRISSPVGLRLRVLYDSAKMGIFPADPSDFPNQGYKMTSKGELTVDNEVVAEKTIYLYKSFSYAPSFLDYGLYTTGSIQ